MSNFHNTLKKLQWSIVFKMVKRVVLKLEDLVIITVFLWSYHEL